MTTRSGQPPVNSKLSVAIGIVSLPKLTETRRNLGYTRLLVIIDKFVINVRKLGTGKSSPLHFVEAFRFAGVDDLTGTTTDPESEGFNHSSSSNNDGR